MYEMEVGPPSVLLKRSYSIRRAPHTSSSVNMVSDAAVIQESRILSMTDISLSGIYV